MILVDPTAHPIVGHRGNCAHAPENTLESIRQALAIGVDAVEFDVHVTSDDALIVLHDKTVDRTTNGSGAIHAMTLRSSRELDAGARFTNDNGRTFPYRGRGIQIPTFDDVMELVGKLPVIIEIKTPTATEALRRAIAKHNMADRVIVAGFDSRAVHPLRNEHFTLGSATSDAARLIPRALLGMRPGKLQFGAMCLPPRWKGIPVPLHALTRAMHKVNGVVHVWTINDPAHARQLWSIGVNGIISDDPQVMINARRDAGLALRG